MIILTDEQKVALSVAFKTAAGNTARVDGAPVWSSSDPAIVEVVAGEDGLTAVATATGALGTAQVVCEADADLGDGVRTITGVLDVEVRAAEAVVAIVAAGAPEIK